ncbi:MAG: hypothetical protein HY520_01915 [Candidatus Aenigmarchaeota archaeon]|nr:hypothetical protein [Candidatus Aenigmarchaeota archaeon]
MPADVAAVEKKIFSTFAEVAAAIGYSPLHGQIIGVLLVRGKALSLQELTKETGYSPSMLSLSLDLLEVLGVVKKVKKTADRKLYVELHGDLLEALKNAVVVRLSKSVASSLQEFAEGKQALRGQRGQEAQQVLQTINTLEEQIRRLKVYVDLLASTGLPK